MHHMLLENDVKSAAINKKGVKKGKEREAEDENVMWRFLKAQKTWPNLKSQI